MSIWASFEDANLPVIVVQVKHKTTLLFIQNKHQWYILVSLHTTFVYLCAFLFYL